MACSEFMDDALWYWGKNPLAISSLKAMRDDAAKMGITHDHIIRLTIFLEKHFAASILMSSLDIRQLTLELKAR